MGTVKSRPETPYTCTQKQIRAYGACIAAKLEGAQGVERGTCEAEFSAVRACFQRQLKAARGK